MKPLLLVCLFGTVFFSLPSCKKGQDQNAGSARLLTSIEKGGAGMVYLNFEYGDHHLLSKITRPDRLNSPFFLYYKNGKLSSIISQAGNTKSSAIIVYGANGKCAKVVYKNNVTDVDNSSPYFTDVSDGKLHGYDTLIYSVDDQLDKIEGYFNAGSGYWKALTVNFYYPNGAAAVANKIVREDFSLAGNSTSYEELTIVTNGMDNPVCRLLWYFPFVEELSYISGGSSNIVSLPLLGGRFDYTGQYLPLVPKCVTDCKMDDHKPGITNNSLGFISVLNHDGFDYSYSPDSLRLRTIPKAFGEGALYVSYNFTNVRN